MEIIQRLTFVPSPKTSVGTVDRTAEMNCHAFPTGTRRQAVPLDFDHRAVRTCGRQPSRHNSSSGGTQGLQFDEERAQRPSVCHPDSWIIEAIAGGLKSDAGRSRIRLKWLCGRDSSACDRMQSQWHAGKAMPESRCSPIQCSYSEFRTTIERVVSNFRIPASPCDGIGHTVCITHVGIESPDNLCNPISYKP